MSIIVELQIILREFCSSCIIVEMVAAQVMIFSLRLSFFHNTSRPPSILQASLGIPESEEKAGPL